MNFYNTPELKTERLILRRFTENDTEALFSIHKDVELNTYLPWFPLRSLEEAEEFYKKDMLRYTTGPVDINMPYV